MAVLWGWAHWLLEVPFPKPGMGHASPLQDKLFVVADVDGGCHESNLAAGITELSNGQEQ